MNKPELLLPAGSLETALAAFDGGADAVYCGLSKFNARERAVNFSFPELRTLLEKAKSCNKKVYVTFNTLIKECELKEVATFLSELARTAPDALIVQDPGVIRMVNKYFPFFTLHASTQMGIHNSSGVDLLEKLNIKRVILERQVTLEELRAIRSRSEMELEVFINGSLCCSLSGRCLLSSFLNGTSGNRGRCKQPCRRCYAVCGTNRKDYFLSPFDLDGSTLVHSLAEMGINSFKVEGRLRGADYIYKTARAYRMLMDHPDVPSAVSEARKLLDSASMRKSSTGFFFESGIEKVINEQHSGIFGIELGTVEKCSVGSFCMKTRGRLHLGDRLRAVDEKSREDMTFTLTSLAENGKPVIKCRAGSIVTIGTSLQVKNHYRIYKIGENGYDYRSAAEALRFGRYPARLKIKASPSCWEVRFSALPDFIWRRKVDFAPAEKHPLKAEDIKQVFSSAPLEPWRIDDVEIELDGRFFAPGSQLKEMRRDFWSEVKKHQMPLDEYFKVQNSALERFMTEDMGKAASPAAVLPDDYFAIPDFIPEAELCRVGKALQKYFDSGGKCVLAGSCHGLGLLQNAPENVEIYMKFPFPVYNSQAAKCLAELGVKAFQPGVELDDEALTALLETAGVPHFEYDEALPLLVTRATLDISKRNDGSGNILHAKRDKSEKTVKLFVENSDLRKAFRKGKLL